MIGPTSSCDEYFHGMAFMSLCFSFQYLEKGSEWRCHSPNLQIGTRDDHIYIVQN